MNTVKLLRVGITKWSPYINECALRLNGKTDTKFCKYPGQDYEMVLQLLRCIPYQLVKLSNYQDGSWSNDVRLNNTYDLDMIMLGFADGEVEKLTDWQTSYPLYQEAELF